ncbi:type IV pilus assembly protein PilW [Acidovorax soli]|uniref:Type IV pilus assembly protein PilW n=1 Tax=Acidovorax soli TaxID=592050 RepID=A0A7X0PF27_9BURK|nr:type IV pilus assembly protein PilW [Acidovorax soli]
MLSKNTPSPAGAANRHLGKNQRKALLTTSGKQRGFTLIELMVGITIGLLTIAVAMGALTVSRNVSGTVTDTSGIQQQAAYAMRVIGLQMRQAGSVRLNMNPKSLIAQDLYFAPVGFETISIASGSAKGFNPSTDTITGTNTPATVTLGYRRFTEPVFGNAAEQTLARNCLGGPDSANADMRLESIFQLTGSELQCSGNGAAAQSIAQNVANFQVRYLLQDTVSTLGDPNIRAVDAAGVGTNWGRVQAVEVCLVLYGIESISMPAGSTYTDCNGTAVDMTTLPSPRNRRMHSVFRNVFQMRSQGLTGAAI